MLPEEFDGFVPAKGIEPLIPAKVVRESPSEVMNRSPAEDECGLQVGFELIALVGQASLRPLHEEACP